MVGTSGFSYSSWRGRFYPRRLKPEAMLDFYAQRLPTVEVNTTFYRTQPEEVVAGWGPLGGRALPCRALRGESRAAGRLAAGEERLPACLEASLIFFLNFKHKIRAPHNALTFLSRAKTSFPPNEKPNAYPPFTF